MRLSSGVGFTSAGCSACCAAVSKCAGDRLILDEGAFEPSLPPSPSMRITSRMFSTFEECSAVYLLISPFTSPRTSSLMGVLWIRNFCLLLSPRASSCD